MDDVAVATKYVYAFSEGSRDMRELLGGKGANVAEMTRVLGADRVPAGFTITTEACVAYMAADRSEPEGLDEQVAEALAALEEQAGQKLGDDEDPLLVSVRSGARESMPGMLDTVLNLGLNDRSVQGLAKVTDNDRFAWDSYRRFVQMFGNVVHGIEGERFEDEIERVKRDRGVEEDTDLDVDALRELVDAFSGFYEFPSDPREQLQQAIRAVFDSWLGDRAVKYRRLNRIPDAWGTAVNVQRMVFGNKGDTSGSGVAFSRDEVTGAPEPSGDFLPNAQGEDVVSGARTPRDISEIAEWMPEVSEQLREILRTLERHYGDMQDTEFTVQEGRLYMLQTRNAKRPAQAAVRFACDAVSEDLLSREQALLTIDAGSLETLVSERFDPAAKFDVAAMGIPASPGGAKGEVVFTAADASSAKAEGRDVILARSFTDAGDVAGFAAAKGILTTTGGKASHAALVARGMGRPAVTGAAKVHIDVRGRKLKLPDGQELAEGDFIAINGSTGEITTDDVPVIAPDVSSELDTVLGWADELRQLGVRANADDAESAARAVELGAEGIGLCRSEHMFLGDRTHLMADVILADDDEARAAAIERLYPLQEDDYAAILEAMDGRPVCVRLLDPPLNEFLPDPDELARGVGRAQAGRGARGGEPDARHPRGAARDPPARPLRDAGAGTVPRRQAGAGGQRRGHGPAGRLRARARVHPRAHRPRGRGGGRERLPDRLHDRAAASVLRSRPDRGAGRVLLLRHERLDPDRSRLLARGHRGADPRALHRGRDPRPLALRDHRRAGRGAARAHGRVAGAQAARDAEDRHLRRARRRPGVDRVLRHLGHRLRVVLAAARARRAPGRRPGGHPRVVLSD